MNLIKTTLIMTFCTLAVLAFVCPKASATGPSNVPWKVEMTDGTRIVFDRAERDGRCTAFNDGPSFVVMIIEEFDGEKWTKVKDIVVKVGRAEKKDIDIKKGQRLRVRTMDRSNPKAKAKGRVTVPWASAP